MATTRALHARPLAGLGFCCGPVRRSVRDRARYARPARQRAGAWTPDLPALSSSRGDDDCGHPRPRSDGHPARSVASWTRMTSSPRELMGWKIRRQARRRRRRRNVPQGWNEAQADEVGGGASGSGSSASPAAPRSVSGAVTRRQTPDPPPVLSRNRALKQLRG